jgi:hypothetical protein
MHYWSSPKLKRLAATQRELDKLLTKLETTPLPLQLVLGAVMVHCLGAAGYSVTTRNHCKDGVYWYTITIPQPKKLKAHNDRERPVSRIIRACRDYVAAHPEVLESHRPVDTLLKVAMTGRDNPAFVRAIIEYEYPPCW